MSDVSEVLDALRTIHLLDGIDEEHLRSLASVSECVAFDQGAVVFREGEQGDDVYLIISGSAALEICAPGVGCRRVLTVQAGDLLGWSPILGGNVFSATARTTSATKAVRVAASQMLAACEYDPRFGYEFMRRAALELSRRLQASRLQLLDLYGRETPCATTQEGGDS